MQLRPREYFPLVYQVSDVTDAATYYPQAVIRNAQTGTILDTVDLTAAGGQRYTANWQVPADGSGLGFYIDITITPWSDAGHTALSNYGAAHATYLVQDRVNATTMGGGGMATVDYRQIRAIVDEAIKAIPKPEKIDIPKVEIPPYPVTDLLPLTRAVENLRYDIPTTVGKESTVREGSLRNEFGILKDTMTAFMEEWDRADKAREAQFQESMDKILERMDAMQREENLGTVVDQVRAFFQEYMAKRDALEERIGKVIDAINGLSFTVKPNVKEDEEEKQEEPETPSIFTNEEES